MAKIILNGSICLMSFNLIGLFYIWCKDVFARIEFWMIYILNMIWFLIIFIDLFKTISSQPQECIQIVML